MAPRLQVSTDRVLPLNNLTHLLTGIGIKMAASSLTWVQCSLQLISVIKRTDGCR